MTESLSGFLSNPGLQERSRVSFNLPYTRKGEVVEVGNCNEGDDYGSALIYAGRVLSIDNGQYVTNDNVRLQELRQKREVTSLIITDELSKAFPDYQPKEILPNIEP